MDLPRRQDRTTAIGCANVAQEAVGDSSWAPDGPYVIAKAYADAIVEGDFLRAFLLLTPELRRSLAGAWVSANTSHPILKGVNQAKLKDALAAPDTDHPLWATFSQITLNEMRDHYTFVDDYDKWGWGSDPRPLGPDRELAVLIRTEGRGGVITTTDTPLPGHGFVMEHCVDKGEGPEISIGSDAERVKNDWRVADFLEPDELLEASR
jgi:hypothetical protein